MALAVCLLPDARSTQLMRELWWARLEDEGVPTLASHTHRRHHPHLSYVVLRSWDLARVQDALDELPPAEPVTLSVHGTLAFPRGRAALAPAITTDVALRQCRVAPRRRRPGGRARNYQAGEGSARVGGQACPGTKLAAVARAVADVLPLTCGGRRARGQRHRSELAAAAPHHPVGPDGDEVQVLGAFCLLRISCSTALGSVVSKSISFAQVEVTTTRTIPS